jgi:hypothetical protein
MFEFTARPSRIIDAVKAGNRVQFFFCFYFDPTGLVLQRNNTHS